MAKSIKPNQKSSDNDKQKVVTKKAEIKTIKPVTKSITPKPAVQSKSTAAVKSTTIVTKPKPQIPIKTGTPTKSNSQGNVTDKKSIKEDVKPISTSKIKKEPVKVSPVTNATTNVATPTKVKKKKFPASVVFGKRPVKKVEEKPTPTKSVTPGKTQQKPTATKPNPPAKPVAPAKSTIPVKPTIVTKPPTVTKSTATVKTTTAKKPVAPIKPIASNKTTAPAKPMIVPTKAASPKPVATAKPSAATQKSAVATKPVATKANTTKAAGKTAIRYSDEDLAIFRNIIEQQKSDIIEEINSLNERIEDFNNRDFTEESTYSLHMAEQTSDALEAEKARNRVSDLTDLLKKLNDAIVRIENKTYGICRICECLIAKERLLVVPVTTLSASYKLHGHCPEDGIDRTEKIK